jgi:serine/threonine-protein kinase
VIERIGHYVVEKPLGAGGMGEVFAAFDSRLERRVAIKLIAGARSGDAAARTRMLREARAASALKHPGIVTVHEIGEAEGRTYIAMELVEGETFAELVARRGPLPAAEAVALVAKVAGAVDAAHQAGILHRDIKSANLMVDARGEVKVLDFGLSKRVGAPPPTPVPGAAPAADDAADAGIDPAAATVVPAGAPTPALGSDAPITAYGARMGTPGYAAPELLDGQDADRTSDVYSLAVVLYELVCGRRPFDAADWHDLRRDMRERAFPPPSQAGPAGVPPRLDPVIHRALAPRRSERFAGAGELVAAARAAIATGGRRRTALVAGAAIGALAVAGGAFALARGGGEPDGDGKRAPAPSIAPASAAPSATLADPSTLRQLTRMGGCAYSPDFADDGTIVFDHTLGDHVDLYRVDRAGAITRVTTAPEWEWRAARGRTPGEVLYLRSDPSGKLGLSPQVVAIDLASGKPTATFMVSTPSAAFAAGDLYFVGRAPPEVRRMRADAEEVILPVQDDLTPYLLAGSPAGDRLAMMSSSMAMGNQLCVVDLAARSLARLKTDNLVNGRPAFAADGGALYYPGRTAIRRIGIDGTGDQEVVADSIAYSGIAVSPSGDLMVWSDCIESGPVKNLSARPPVVAVAERIVHDITVGPRGEYAYIPRPSNVLRLRLADGKRRDLTNARLGTPTQPSFSPDGSKLAFYVKGAAPGLYVRSVAVDAMPQPITDDATDRSVRWLDGDTLAFARSDARDFPVPYTVAVDGGAPVPIKTRPSLPVGVLRSTGELLLAAPGWARTWWWNPATGRERPGPALKLPRLTVTSMELSHDGRWAVIRAGQIGQLVYRMAIEPPGKPELIYEAATDEVTRDAAITDAGEVLAAPMKYQGELHAIAAGHGRRF